MPRLQHKPRNKSGIFGVYPGSRKSAYFGNNFPAVLTPPKPYEATKSLIHYGFKELALSQEPIRTYSGPGYEDPPPGLLGGTTSISEWYIYYVLLRLLGPEGQDWSYQQSVLGGRHGPGGAVVDFVVYWRGLAYGLRIQTYRFHISAGPVKQGYDERQLLDISTPQMRVIDIYEEDFIFDKTGKAAFKVTLEALNGEYMLSPIASGRAFGIG